MNPLLDAFLVESREALERIGTILLRMENSPEDRALMEELFRLVHTLKGSSGLFQFPELTRVLHAGEDLMSALREGRIEFDRPIADQLLEAMDFVGMLCDEIDATGSVLAAHAEPSIQLSERLRSMIGQRCEPGSAETIRPDASESVFALGEDGQLHPLDNVPVAIREAALEKAREGIQLHWVRYLPTSDCFFHGEDPLHVARQTPGILYGRIVARDPWPPLPELDAYKCVLEFQVLAAASAIDLAEHFRYVLEQVRVTPIDSSGFIESQTESDHSESSMWCAENLPPEDREALSAILGAQRHMLESASHPKGREWRLLSAATVLERCATAVGDHAAQPRIVQALERSLAEGSGKPLQLLVDEWIGLEHLSASRRNLSTAGTMPTADDSNVARPVEQVQPRSPEGSEEVPVADAETPLPKGSDGPCPGAGKDVAPKFGRRAEDHIATKTLKVDQEKIDRLMNLIGEMVVAKNALPYLARRAEEHFGTRELSREIKSHHAAINRIAEEMQDAIMQVRMMPISVVFQRFPRLVRDVSRKLGKDVELVLEGEETEADKNIVESLADPLLHMVRNSLDHGMESPEVRRALGKPLAGRLTMRALQEGDRVVIEIQDDGKGIDPAIVKVKAYQKGLIDEATLERISDRDALHLVFAPGFSTAEEVSDLSGRGVGMDVVRTAVEKVHGTISLESVVGSGTLVRIVLPLSMAVTKVMVVESDRQIFGIPMDLVSETVRIPREAIHCIKSAQATVLRGKFLPLRPLNGLLGLGSPPVVNAEGLYAVLVVRLEHETLGLVVDDFRGTLDVIQKPLGSVLSGLNAYSGSALMGDGKVLMVLNLKEMV